jgi:hypothetical protein
MKFFTREWAGKAVPKAYQAHLSKLLPRMPATVRAPAQGVNIHDGRLRAATLDRAHHTLTLSMRCGDNRVGYFDLELVYYEAVLSDGDVVALREVSRDLEAEAQYDELDLTDAGAWLHRMTFWRDHEVAVSFERLALRLEPMPNREFLRLPDVYVEVPSGAF